MVLDKLGSSLREILKKIGRSALIDEATVNDIVKDIQRALLQADVNVKLVFDLSKKIKERALNEEVKLSPKEHLINIIYEEIASLLGGDGRKIEVKGKPFKILLLGLFGHGKTTSAAKLAKFYKKRGLKIALLGLDTFRQAAREQLMQLGEQIGVPVLTQMDAKDPTKIIEKFEPSFKDYDILIADSAGRTILDSELKKEIEKINSAFKPNEKILVIGAEAGQGAEREAKAFHDSLKVTGVLISKMEGSAKGGGALSACAITGAPVYFIGTGEKIDELEDFDSKKFVSKLLGFGDLEGLIQKVKELSLENELSPEDMMKEELNLKTFYQQLEATKKMGSLGKIMKMIPMGVDIPEEMLNQGEEKMKSFKIIIDSMTERERIDPEIIDSSRIQRISAGSGRTAGEVKELLKQFRQMKKVFKGMKTGKFSGKIGKMMESLKKGGFKMPKF